MPLANAIVARLASGDVSDDEFCGLLLVINWPAADDVQSMLAPFSAATLPASAYLYPPTSLHCTVATLRAFTGGPLDADKSEATRWMAVLDAASAMPSWPNGPVKLRMMAPTFEGAAGIMRYEELAPGGAIDAMRACLREAIMLAGGVPAEGSADRSHAKPLGGAPASEPPPHLPNIIHSTVLRWATEPSEAEVERVRSVFEQVAASWTPLDFTVNVATTCGVYETVPFMHIPHEAKQVFWRRLCHCPAGRTCQCGPECACAPGQPGCDPCKSFAIAKAAAEAGVAAADTTG